MTDCAARGTAPRRAAASATISKAALIKVYTRGYRSPPLGERDNSPFRPDHEDSGESELQKLDAGASIEHCLELESTPRLVPRVCRRADGIHDEEEESEPEGEREGDWGADDAESGVVYEIEVERDVDGRDNDEDVCGRIHDPFFLKSVALLAEVRQSRTLTLQIFLEAFKANISRCGEQQHSQVLLCVSTELLFLTEGHQDRRHVRPYYANGDEEEPQQG